MRTKAEMSMLSGLFVQVAILVGMQCAPIVGRVDLDVAENSGVVLIRDVCSQSSSLLRVE